MLPGQMRGLDLENQGSVLAYASFISSTDEKHCETEKTVVTILLRAILVCKSFTLPSMM